MTSAMKLGPCCACGGDTKVRNIIMLHSRAPVPGTGWGCVVCGLPPDGAVAVLCNRCLGAGRRAAQVCDGYPGEGKRVPLPAAPQPFDHDRNFHPELWKCARCGCTQNEACRGGCYWIKIDLCSACATVEEVCGSRL